MLRLVFALMPMVAVRVTDPTVGVAGRVGHLGRALVEQRHSRNWASPASPVRLTPSKAGCWAAAEYVSASLSASEKNTPSAPWPVSL